MISTFMSYPREYRTVVERLVTDLRSSGYDAFFDDQLSGGQRWWDELLHRIEVADAFVPVIGRAYLSSTPCSLEAQYAAALGKSFLPLAVESIPAGLFAEAIATAQWVDYDPSQPTAVLKVIRALNQLPPAPPLPDPMPPRPVVPISYMTQLQGEIAREDEIGRARQLSLVADLKARLNGPDRDAAVMLLGRLRQRPDVCHQAAIDIDQLLGQPTPRPQPQPPPRQEGPRPQPVAPAPYPPQRKPDNHYLWTIGTTLLCCLPLGIVGIVYSSQVDSLWNQGKYAEAAAASDKARTWAIVSAVVGACLIVVVLLASAGSTSGTGA